MDSLQLLSRIKKIPLVADKLTEGLLSGNYRSVFRGPGLEFDEVRQYLPGDDVRMIDWNVTSRMSEPYVKTFREERELVLFLLIDISPSMATGSGTLSKRDSGAVAAALLAFAAENNKDRIGAVFFTDRIEKWVPPAKGRNHVHSLINDLVSLKPRGRGSDLGLAVRTVHEALKRRGICVLLSDFRSAGGLREMTILSRRHDVMAVKISDPLEKDFPEGGMFEARDPESGRIRTFYGASKGFRKDFIDFWETQHLFWERQCRRRGIDVVTVDTEEDPAEALLRFFARRKIR